MEKAVNSSETSSSKSSQVSNRKETESTKDADSSKSQKGKRVGFVLVHAGAGYHSESKAKEYKHVCKRACKKVGVVFGFGFLDFLDTTYCYSPMHGYMVAFDLYRYFASAAVLRFYLSGGGTTTECIKNPVLAANKLLFEGQKGKLSAGRIPPWYEDRNQAELSLAAFKRNKRKLELAEKVETDFIQIKKRRQSSEKENDSGTLDTVGAIVVDQDGNVAAAVSSGGLAMKHPGRVGQAALYGCGCWAENTGVHNPYSTAVSTSGCGEHLVRTILARECSLALQAEDAHQALLESMQNKFIGSPFLANEDSILGGVIVLRSCRCSSKLDSTGNKQALLVEFLWSHTTESMCVGYMSAQDGKAKTHISRLPPGAVAGQSVAIEGGVCRLESSLN
ncbi:threonine aspartase 1 [Pyxicephalus adspersus]|uniref:threonine aspartase 1 n=1 Tax=Pyxicephalus adspersus TaxID=30357 RepID=UPI003B5C6D78